jgi:hypothetical protein
MTGFGCYRISLMALCYNFSRVLHIMGFDRWMALLAQRPSKPIRTLVAALLTADRRLSKHPVAIWRTLRRSIPLPRPRLAFPQ